jgi:signal transduction histidine kinase
VEVDAAAMPELPAAVEVAAYRIATEAVTNVLRHASAARCVVRLRASDDALTVEVIDDGRGIGDRATAGVGLRSMRERAAELGGEFVVSTTESGTAVSARLPLEAR